MAKVRGVIEAKARNRKGIKIGDDWYSAFKEAQLQGADKGDEVEFTVKEVTKGGSTFLNIEGNVTIHSRSEKEEETPKASGSVGGAKVSGPTRTDRQNVRQNAKVFESYVLGD
jgi:hypothetical protein